MEDTNSLIEQRKTKLQALQAKGINPFANKFTPGEKCGVARKKYEEGEYKEGQAVTLAGRITAHREMGKSIFIDIKDQSGRIQVYAQKNSLGDDQFHIFTHLDIGDFIGVQGTMFVTRMGEISVKLEQFTILGKALRPPPEKWHGLVDTEIRYRQRYLDLMANDSVKDTFLKRSAIVREIRNFFHDRGYVEVETPVLQGIPGGAAAQPFKTKHNALGCEFYLRIALELYHKRLLVGGVDKLFEIGKNFRNEGLSRKHNPEFTMLEAYEAYGDYATMMETVESLICQIAQKVLGTLKIEHNKKTEVETAICNLLDAVNKLRAGYILDRLIGSEGGEKSKKLVSAVIPSEDAAVQKLHEELKALATEPSYKVASRLFEMLHSGRVDLVSGLTIREIQSPEHISRLNDFEKVFKAETKKLEDLSKQKIIDLTGPWKRARYKDLVKSVGGADWFEVTSAERRRRAIEDLKLAGDIADGYEDFEVTGAVFEKLIEPTLIQPTFVTHLPKELVPLAKLSVDDPSTVEVFECCINGQEVSPGYTEQNDPVAQRITLENQAGGEQQKLDDDFLTALEHGMPPAGGIGIGIDRLCMMLLGQESIRDVILFPQMKPK